MDGNEFIDFCRAINTEPMLGVNMGTGTIEEAASLVEYCNGAPGTAMADLRIAHGYPKPHNVRYWCLGNEMDGPWQIGHLEPTEYARKAREAAKMMKWHDPDARLILCGSSGTSLPTYPEWDRVSLEACWDVVDYMSLHTYVGNRDNDTDSYLADWRRADPVPVGDDLAAEVEKAKAEMEAAFTQDKLKTLIANGGKAQ